MGLFELYSSNVKIKYKSNFCSTATIFTIITTLLGISLPLIIAYRSRGFWLKNYMYHEQPTVRFKYQYLVLLETKNLEDVFVCGNIGFNVRESSECSVTKIKEVDDNQDGKIDEFYFYLQANMDFHEIATINAYLLFDFQLHKPCSLQMEAMAHYQKDLVLPSIQLAAYGDLKLHQRNHLNCYFNSMDTTFNTSVFSTNDPKIETMMEDYFRRNVSTYLRNTYQKSKHGQSSQFDFELRIRIPEQEVRYRPGFFQEIKWAWLQYFPIAFVFFYFIEKIRHYVFGNRLLVAWEIVPWEKRY